MVTYQGLRDTKSRIVSKEKEFRTRELGDLS